MPKKPKKKEYAVRFPTMGWVEFDVHAESEEEAIELAKEKVYNGDDPDEKEYEIYDHEINSGIFCGPCEDIEVSCYDED